LALVTVARSGSVTPLSPPEPPPSQRPAPQPGRSARRDIPSRLADRQQTLLGLWRRDAGQRPYLGLGQFATRKRSREERQSAERSCHAYALARRAELDADAPCQPMRA